MTASPTEGNRWDLNVGGNDVKEPSIGLQRSRVFGPASEDTQQTKPPEEEAGENSGGSRLGNETLCHESSYETLSLLSLSLSLSPIHLSVNHGTRFWFLMLLIFFKLKY